MKSLIRSEENLYNNLEQKKIETKIPQKLDFIYPTFGVQFKNACSLFVFNQPFLPLAIGRVLIHKWYPHRSG